MTPELIEKVARAIDPTGFHPSVSKDDPFAIMARGKAKHHARAAITLVVEECAKVAEGFRTDERAIDDTADGELRGRDGAAEEIAAAIRALAKEAE